MKRYMAEMSHEMLETQFADWWEQNADDFTIMTLDPPVPVNRIKAVAQAAFHNGAIAREEWQEITESCEHEWRYGGLKYQENIDQKTKEVRGLDHYDWFYCVRCLEFVGKFLYSSGYPADSAFPMPVGGTFEQAPPDLP